MWCRNLLQRERGREGWCPETVIRLLTINGTVRLELGSDPHRRGDSGNIWHRKCHYVW
jgi:hypothetical protein